MHYLGRNSLELFLINGFVLMFINIPLMDVPVSEIGFGLGGFDVIIFMVVAQLLLVWLMRPFFTLFRSATGWLAAQAIGMVASLTPPSRQENAEGR